MRERTARGDAIYGLDEQLLRELEPDLIVTQELCPVCAVSYDEVQAIAKKLPVCPEVIALDPQDVRGDHGGRAHGRAGDRRARARRST